MTDTHDYGTRIGPRAVRFERLLPGPIERVWSYLAQSDKRAQWLARGDMPTRAGETFSMTFDNRDLSPGTPAPERYRDMEGEMTQTFRLTAFDPPRRLAYDWGEDREASSQVAFELTPEGEMVRLVVTHTRLSSHKGMLMVSAGWHTHLEHLAAALGEGPAQAFWTRFGELESFYETRFLD